MNFTHEDPEGNLRNARRMETVRQIYGGTVSPQQMAAIAELERRGFVFCCHFGVLNAEEILSEMNGAAADGTLYRWLRERLGVL